MICAKVWAKVASTMKNAYIRKVPHLDAYHRDARVWFAYIRKNEKNAYIRILCNLVVKSTTPGDPREPPGIVEPTGGAIAGSWSVASLTPVGVATLGRVAAPTCLRSWLG